MTHSFLFCPDGLHKPNDQPLKPTSTGKIPVYADITAWNGKDLTVLEAYFARMGEIYAHATINVRVKSCAIRATGDPSGRQEHDMYMFADILKAIAPVFTSFTRNFNAYFYILGTNTMREEEYANTIAHFSPKKDKKAKYTMPPGSKAEDFVVPVGELMADYWLMCVPGKDGRQGHGKLGIMGGPMSNFEDFGKGQFIDIKKASEGTIYADLLAKIPNFLSTMGEHNIHWPKVSGAAIFHRYGELDMSFTRGNLEKLVEKEGPKNHAPDSFDGKLLAFAKEAVAFSGMKTVTKVDKKTKVAADVEVKNYDKDDKTFRAEFADFLLKLFLETNADGVITMTGAQVKKIGGLAPLDPKVFDHLNGNAKFDLDDPMLGLNADCKIGGSVLSMAVIWMMKTQASPALLNLRDVCISLNIHIVEVAAHEKASFIDGAWGIGGCCKYLLELDVSIRTFEGIGNIYGYGIMVANLLSVDGINLKYTDIFTKERCDAFRAKLGLQYVTVDSVTRVCVDNIIDCYLQGFGTTLDSLVSNYCTVYKVMPDLSDDLDPEMIERFMNNDNSSDVHAWFVTLHFNDQSLLNYKRARKDEKNEFKRARKEEESSSLARAPSPPAQRTHTV